MFWFSFTSKCFLNFSRDFFFWPIVFREGGVLFISTHRIFPKYPSVMDVYFHYIVWLNSFKFIKAFLWCNIWSILEHVPCAFKKNIKNIYYTVIGWSVLQKSVRSNWLTVFLMFSISLLIVYLVVLSIIENKVLESYTIIVELCISPFNSIGICLLHFGIMSLCAFMFIFVISSDGITLLYIMSFFVSSNFFCLKVYFL